PPQPRGVGRHDHAHLPSFRPGGSGVETSGRLRDLRTFRVRTSLQQSPCGCKGWAMSGSFNPYALGTIAEQPVETRAEFVRKTYTHLAGAIVVFAVLEWFLLETIPASAVFGLLSASSYSWLMVLGAFMVVSWIANKWAYGGASKSMQYAGLALYVVAEAVIFLPLLMIASQFDPAAIGKAAVVTGFMVLGLTTIAFTTRKDFTFL